MSVNSTSSVSLAAMPVAGQVPGTGARSRVSAANSRVPSGAAAVTSACVHDRAPEQYRLMPSSRQPPPARLAISPGPGGCAAQTPHRLPSGGGPTPSSARMASASACPSDRRARDRSSPASSARLAQRSQVRPPPGSDRFSRPDPTAAAKASATDAASGPIAVGRSPSLIIATPNAASFAARHGAVQTPHSLEQVTRCKCPPVPIKRSIDERGGRVRSSGGMPRGRISG
jgi:hypothetical protein